MPLCHITGKRNPEGLIRCNCSLQAPAQEAPHAVEVLLDEELPSLPELELGQLDNGLRYVILPNKVPANRFEAHLEIHAGAVGPRLLSWSMLPAELICEAAAQ